VVREGCSRYHRTLGGEAGWPILNNLGRTQCFMHLEV
jgi:hypothetical protein